MFLLAIGVGLLLVLVLPILVPVIYGLEYVASIPVIWILLPGIVVTVLFWVLVGDLAARGRQEAPAICFSVAVVVNVLLGLLLIPRHGVMGAAAAASTSYIIGTLMFTVWYRRIVA